MRKEIPNNKLVDEKSTAWHGKPAKLLQFKFMPRLSRQDQKYVKEFEGAAQVWIGTDGIPLAVETQTRMKGRALLVIKFEEQQKESFHITRIGNRLFVINHTHECCGSGGGESNQSKTVVTINPA